MSATTFQYDPETRAILDLAQKVGMQLVRRTKKALPDDAECRDLFEQWAGAMELSDKYPEDKQATAVVLALHEQLVRAMQRCGVTHF